MRHATFRQLEVFEAIARLDNFTRAAEELFLTQPTVSMQVKKLNDAVGCRCSSRSASASISLMPAKRCNRLAARFSNR